jgi:hypothetical protein
VGVYERLGKPARGCVRGWDTQGKAAIVVSGVMSGSMKSEEFGKKMISGIG